MKSLLYPCWGETPQSKSSGLGFLARLVFKAFFTVKLLLKYMLYWSIYMHIHTALWSVRLKTKWLQGWDFWINVKLNVIFKNICFCKLHFISTWKKFQKGGTNCRKADFITGVHHRFLQQFQGQTHTCITNTLTSPPSLTHAHIRVTSQVNRQSCLTPAQQLYTTESTYYHNKYILLSPPSRSAMPAIFKVISISSGHHTVTLTVQSTLTSIASAEMWWDVCGSSNSTHYYWVNYNEKIVFNN